MSRSVLSLLRASLALLLGTISAHAADEAAPDNKANHWFNNYSAETFRNLDGAQQEIDPLQLREPLLAAAIFHETNRRRAEQKLPALAFHEKVRAASAQHAQAMARHRTLSHGTPWERSNSTPHERLVALGLQPAFSAENVALHFVLRYEPGKPFHTRVENGRSVHSYEAGGTPLPRHTFLSFAEALLDQWLKSPAHRKNILATAPAFLGVGCGLAKGENGFDMVYAAQVFFAANPA